MPKEEKTDEPLITKADLARDIRLGKLDNKLRKSRKEDCPTCGHQNTLNYLALLKSGDWDIGKSTNLAYSIATGVSGNVESITPIYLKGKCERCGANIGIRDDPSLSVEYLLQLMRAKEAPSSFYC